MIKRELYEKAYDILNKLTPLKTDCGELCNRACCDSADQDAGMYLFPGEELMYSDMPDWLRIEKSSFTYGNGKTALIAICSGQCKRELRPLSCRIFPLTSYIDHNRMLSIKIDPRAIPLCPLAKPFSPETIDDNFIKSVADVFKLLAKEKEIISFIVALSREIDQHESLIRSFTTGKTIKKRSRAIRRKP